MLISVQGSHFKNDVISQVCKRRSIKQDLVVAYSPWINGSVERLNRDVLQVVRALLIEHELDTREWPYLLPVVQASLNHTLVQSLDSKSPTELITALLRPSPFESILVERHGRPSVVVAETGLPEGMVDKIRGSLVTMHRDVKDQHAKRRQQSQSRSSGDPCNFTVGDFVLWSLIDKRLSKNKLLARWVGPFEVQETRAHSFIIQHLITKQDYEVHGSRLKFYSDASLNVNDELLAHVGNQGMMLGVESIKGHRQERGAWQILISWVGLQDEKDSWKALRDMVAEIPVRVADYVLEASDAGFTAAYNRVKRQANKV